MDNSVPPQAVTDTQMDMTAAGQLTVAEDLLAGDIEGGEGGDPNIQEGKLTS